MYCPSPTFGNGDNSNESFDACSRDSGNARHNSFRDIRLAIHGAPSMIRKGFSLPIAACLIGIATPAFALKNVFTQVGNGYCQILSEDVEVSSARCPAPARYRFFQYDADSNLTIAIGKAIKFGQHDLSWRWTGEGMGPRIEWRLDDAEQPVSMILRRTRVAPDDLATKYEEVVIVKVTPTGACIMGAFDALAPFAIRSARQFADERYAQFRCEHDEPVIKSSRLPIESTTRIEAGHLDHNGSLMSLTRGDGDRVEIRYREPRKGLNIPPGTLLFSGTRGKDGALVGTAFTFKPGCEPAAYAVRGNWESSWLLLSGAAPVRKSSSCEVVRYDSKSRNATLSFVAEPINAYD
jgi:hypothetical protein